jgi:hypothetical protein
MEILVKDYNERMERSNRCNSDEDGDGDPVPTEQEVLQVLNGLPDLIAKYIADSTVFLKKIRLVPANHIHHAYFIIDNLIASTSLLDCRYVFTADNVEMIDDPEEINTLVASLIQKQGKRTKGSTKQKGGEVRAEMMRCLKYLWHELPYVKCYHGKEKTYRTQNGMLTYHDIVEKIAWGFRHAVFEEKNEVIIADKLVVKAITVEGRYKVII